VPAACSSSIGAERKDLAPDPQGDAGEPASRVRARATARRAPRARRRCRLCRLGCEGIGSKRPFIHRRTRDYRRQSQRRRFAVLPADTLTEITTNLAAPSSSSPWCRCLAGGVSWSTPIRSPKSCALLAQRRTRTGISRAREDALRELAQCRAAAQPASIAWRAMLRLAFEIATRHVECRLAGH
jgi:hypothetical protein